MIIEVKVKNFKSFKDSQVISTVAGADLSLANNLISTPALTKLQLLRSSVIYGANASGKSNFLAAIKFIRDFVARSSTNRLSNSPIGIDHFRLDPVSQVEPSEFVITFIHNKVRFKYGFSVDKMRVHEEWLIAYPKGSAQIWFERASDAEEDDKNWYFGRHLKGEKNRLVPLTRPDSLFLPVAAQFNHPQLSAIYRWFTTKLHFVDSNMDTVTLEKEASKEIIANKNRLNKVKNLLAHADFGIVNLSIESNLYAITVKTPEGETSMREGPELRRLVVYHRTHEEDEVGIKFELESESEGTRRLLGLSNLFFRVLETGATLIVDELDTSLHPILGRALINLFHSPKTNPHGAQLIFNTHDATLLDLTVFRRDQIWFVEKDECGASHLYPLLEFKPRKTEAISKGYLQGRYGAVPFLGNIEDFIANDTEHQARA